MKSRIVFIALLIAMAGFSGFAIYRIFFTGTELQQPTANPTSSKKPGSKMGTGSSDSLQEKDEGHSIWADPRLRGLSGTGSDVDVAKAQEIEGNLKNLVTLFDRGEDKEFLVRLDALIASNPDVKEYVALKGDYYFNEGKWPEAEEAVRSLITKDPENMFARTTLAEIQAAQGKIEDAFQTQQEVISKDPGNADALNGVLAVTEMQGKPERGEEIVRKNAQSNMQNGNAVAPYVDLLRAQGKSEEAQKITQESLKLDPTNPDLLQREAAYLIQQGKIPEAMATADQSANFAQTPAGKITALALKGTAAYSIRNVSVMEQVANEIKAIDPHHETLAFLQEQIEMLKK